MSQVRPRSHAASSAALELVVVAGDAVTVAALPEGGAVALGRGEDCEIRIDSRAVSRRHAILHLDPPLRIQDLGSANGTFVRDARVPTDTAGTQPLRKLSREVVEIAVGERVNLGSIPIVIRRAGAVRAAAGPDGIIIRDPAMRRLYEDISRAARSTAKVLILGETGVGKEVLAKAIHDRSPRAGRPFLELNCGALMSSVLEGELFGHERGAFTGASEARPGLFEAADGGTVFLDEIGDMPLEVQVKVLKVLEEQKVLRIGGRAPRKIDVRIVAATHRDLEAEIARGAFRQDLYFRINTVTFTIPPLRDRPSEIAPLAERFLAAAASTLDGLAPQQLSPEALAYLERYTWPGNVRELRNVIERAAVLASGAVIVPADLPGHVTGATRRAAPGLAPAAVAVAADDLPATAAGSAAGHAAAPEDTAERQRILDALAQCAGNQTRAAKLLGMSLRTLVNRLSKYNVTRPRKPS